MKAYRQQIKEQLDKVVGMNKTSEYVASTIRHATEFLSQPWCRYTNEDIDVMNSLCQCENKWVS